MNSVVAGCEILVIGSFFRNNVLVSYDSHELAYSVLEKEFIDSLWSAAVAKNSNNPGTLFNGRLFSLRSWNNDCGNLHLELGDTCYMNYFGTRSKDFRVRFPGAPQANPLAVCSVLVTLDSYIIIDKRSGGDVYSNAFHVIGGFMDRDMDIKGGAIVDPFFSIGREVMEEVFADISECDGILTGLVYDKRTPHPELCFSYSINLNLADVLDRVKTADSREVGEIIGLSNDKKSISAFLLDNLDSISVTGLGCLLLHGLKSFGDEWYFNICAKLNCGGGCGTAT